MSKLEKKEIDIRNEGILLEEYFHKKMECNTESDLILIKDRLYKILKFHKRRKQNIVEQIYGVSHNLPFEICDLYYDEGIFHTYSMPFYEKYKTIYEVAREDVDLQTRKDIALFLIKLFYEFYEKFNLVYTDWHGYNFLYLDSLKMLDVDSADYDCCYVKAVKYGLIKLCYFVLSGIDIEEDIDYYIDLKKLFIPMNSTIMYSNNICLEEYQIAIQNCTVSILEEQRGILLNRII